MVELVYKFDEIQCTVEPQSYGLHSYGKLGQPDTIFGKYHQNFYKMGTGHQVLLSNAKL